MPDFKFLGFSAGSGVALSVHQNGQNATATLASWGSPDNAIGTVAITPILPSRLVAPTNVVFEAHSIAGLAQTSLAGAVYDPEYHEYFYFWSIRGAPLDAFAAPQNMISNWNDPNVCNAPRGMFCLTKPGTYIIDLVVVDHNGDTAIAESQSFVVEDANDVYLNDKTICVSFEDEFNEAPANATHVTSMSALISAIEARGDAETRVLYRRGETFDNHRLRIKFSRRANYFGTFGSATPAPVIRPVFVPDGDTDGNSCLDVTEQIANDTITITGLKFKGAWDVSSETGSWGFQTMVEVSQTAFENTHVTLHGLEFEDVFTAISIQGGRSDRINNRFMIADCVVEGWKNYGIFCAKRGGDTIAVIGNRIVQKVDALNGGQKTVGLMNNHGPARFADITGVYFSMNDVFSRTGWSGLDQQCLRLATSSLSDQWSFTDRNVLEGGYLNVSLEGQNAGEPDVPGNHVVQRNVLVGTAVNNLDFVAVHRGGTSVRANYGFVPANKYVRANSGVRHAFAFRPNKSEDGNENEPVALFANTVLALRDVDQSNGLAYELSDFETFTTFVDENNLLHAPYLASPVTADAPIDMTGSLAGITLRYKGTRVGYEPVALTLPATVADGVSVIVPYSMIHQRLAAKPGSVNPIDFNGETETDQAYWQTLGPEDTNHTITIPGIGTLCADLGHLSVSFEAAGATITNTSGMTWGEDGLEISLKLHRNSKIPPMDTDFGHEGASVPLPVPANNQSNAWETAAGQFVMRQEFATQDIRGLPMSRGAFDA